MRSKSLRRVAQVETAATAKDAEVVDSTMCGCEVDPLSGRTFCNNYIFVLA